MNGYVSSVTGKSTGTAPQAIHEIANTATVRAIVNEFEIGTTGASSGVDTSATYQCTRTTALGTGAASPPTPMPLNALSPAASCTTLHAVFSVQPTFVTPGMQFGLNARATFRWMANPNQEFMALAATTAGFCINALTSPTAITIDATIFWNE